MKTKPFACFRHLLAQVSIAVMLALFSVHVASASTQNDVTEMSTEPGDGSRDFDFAFGEWQAHISRRLDPLTGSDAWVDYEGSTVVHRIWNGRAHLVELDVSGESGTIQGLSLRTYNPETRQWYISWASSRNGEVGPPMVGGFRNGVGEFYNQETYNGRYIFVRFIFSGITETTFNLEQAFSADGGKTWEANWIARFRRQ